MDCKKETNFQFSSALGQFDTVQFSSFCSLCLRFLHQNNWNDNHKLTRIGLGMLYKTYLLKVCNYKAQNS